MKCRLGRQFAGVVVVLGASAIGWGCAARETTTYSLAVTYSALPRDDSAIERWIEARPDTGEATVNRRGPEVSFRFWTNPRPDRELLRQLMAACDRLGYRGRISYRGTLSDRAQRGTNRLTLWAEFAELPADDRVMVPWLQSASGTANSRIARDGNVVAFSFDLASPPPPTIQAEILKKCSESGYERPVGYVSAFGRYD